MIVSGNEGSVQTTDISVETGKDIWLVVTGPEAYEVFYEKPADTAAVSNKEAASDTEAADAGESAEQTEAVDVDAAADAQTAEAGISTGTIVLIVVVCVAVIALAAYFILKKKKA